MYRGEATFQLSKKCELNAFGLVLRSVIFKYRRYFNRRTCLSVCILSVLPKKIEIGFVIIQHSVTFYDVSHLVYIYYGIQKKHCESHFVTICDILMHLMQFI